MGERAAAATAAGAGADVVLNGITGSIGLRPTLAALARRGDARPGEQGVAHRRRLARHRRPAAPGQIVPVDSEHSAIAQGLRGGTRRGGPPAGRHRQRRPVPRAHRDELADVTPEQALAHPTWAMGRVVTTNSATLVNKGLEVIEAHLLFDIPFDAHRRRRPPAVGGPLDGGVPRRVDDRPGLAARRCSSPSPSACPGPTGCPTSDAPCDWTRRTAWEFEPLDDEAFPAVGWPARSGAAGGTYPAVYNAANEVCVDAFHERRIGFLGIVDTVAGWSRSTTGGISTPESVDGVLRADAWARATAPPRRSACRRQEHVRMTVLPTSSGSSSSSSGSVSRSPCTRSATSSRPSGSASGSRSTWSASARPSGRARSVRPSTASRPSRRRVRPDDRDVPAAARATSPGPPRTTAEPVRPAGRGGAQGRGRGARPGDEDRVFYRLPVRRKLLVMVGGATMNLILAVLMFASSSRCTACRPTGRAPSSPR